MTLRLVAGIALCSVFLNCQIRLPRIRAHRKLFPRESELKSPILLHFWPSESEVLKFPDTRASGNSCTNAVIRTIKRVRRIMQGYP